MKPHVAAILVLGVVMAGLWLWQPGLFELDLAAAAPASSPTSTPEPSHAREYGAALLGLLLLGVLALGADWRDRL